MAERGGALAFDELFEDIEAIVDERSLECGEGGTGAVVAVVDELAGALMPATSDVMIGLTASFSIVNGTPFLKR
jgi:hypothetical protein